MEHRIIKAVVSSVAVATVALGGAAPALAAKHHRGHRHGTSTQSRTGNGETPLTGSTLTSAENAATAANPGSTAKGASTETDSSLSGAAYEVHIVKPDGSRAVVIEDSSFNVLATQADGGCNHGGPGDQGPGQH
jgi:hypothetical protein